MSRLVIENNISLNSSEKIIELVKKHSKESHVLQSFLNGNKVSDISKEIICNFILSFIIISPIDDRKNI